MPQEKLVTELHFPRLTVDGAEGTCFDTVTIIASPKQFAPPALPFSVSPLIAGWILTLGAC